MGVWESGLIHRTANAAALNWARWFKSNRARQTDPLGLCESKHTTRTLYNKYLRRKVSRWSKTGCGNKGYSAL